MIGHIELHGQRATLGDDLRWQSDNQEWADLLNFSFGSEGASPADGVPGRAAIIAAAQEFEATYEIAGADDEYEIPAGVVY